MTEMTVPKITLLLDTFAKACGDNSKAKELCKEAINFIVKQEREGEVIAVLAEARRVALEQQAHIIEAQVREIDSLKCCAICKFYSNCSGNCLHPKPILFLPQRTDKCKKWEGVSMDD